MEEKKLFLIDGYSLLYRSFYAIQRLSTSKGFPTNAVYGFINTLRKLIQEHKPEYLGVVFDTRGPTVRHEAYKEYKAQRKPMPEDLQVQISVLKNILKAMKIPLFEFEKYEADDVLGSLAQKAQEEKLQTVIVSADKDLFQLVNKNTSVYNPTKELYFNEEKVREVFGVYPHQVIDVLALWGDASDNVPGVPGIGEKTSKTLISEFGSLDNLLKNLEKIKNQRLKEKITHHLDELKMSRQLVTIEKELNVEFNLEEFRLEEPDYEEVTRLFHELEFNSLMAEYLKKKESKEKNYKIILEETELKELIAAIKKAGLVSLDTETDSPFPTRARLVGMSFSLKPHHAYYLPLGHDYRNAPAQISKKRALHLLEEILSDTRVSKAGQNIKYDYIVLKREGVKLDGLDFDSMVLSYLIEPNWGKHNLGRLALHYLHTQATPYEEIAGKGKSELTLNRVAVEKVAPYACQDADFALQLSTILWERVRDEGLDRLYREIELPLIRVLAEMEIWGVKVDASSLKDLSTEFEQELNYLTKKIYETSGEEFNINSPQQLADVLFNKMKLPASKRTKTSKGYSTSVTVLKELARIHPIAEYLLEYRQLSKLKSSYADSLPLLINPETGRIHTSYNQTVTATGRLSSSDPNLQNIPARGELGRRFRQAFIPEKGHLLLSADYSQIELRVLAHFSEDPALLETFKQDHDVHQDTALRVFGEDSLLFKEEQRRRAKIINFSIIYGASAYSLSRELGTSVAEAQAFIDRYFEKHTKVSDFLEKIVNEAREKGFSQTLFGRKRQVPELKHADKLTQQAGRRIALNTPIQGTAADLMKKAMVDIWRELKKRSLKSKMILQVHDELVFEVPDRERDEMETLVREKMENVFPLKAPLKVHLGWGINWAEAK
ncbi:MAG: DNA polymerase I [Candidatus Aminicenantales bacterium]